MNQKLKGHFLMSPLYLAAAALVVPFVLLTIGDPTFRPVFWAAVQFVGYVGIFILIAHMAMRGSAILEGKE